MNPVALPVVPTTPGVPAAVRTQASREEQAAFSPALMMLLAAGAAPPAIVAPAPAPEPVATVPAPIDATGDLAVSLDSGRPLPELETNRLAAELADAEPTAPRLDVAGGKHEPVAAPIASGGTPRPAFTAKRDERPEPVTVESLRRAAATRLHAITTPAGETPRPDARVTPGVTPETNIAPASGIVAAAPDSATPISRTRVPGSLETSPGDAADAGDGATVVVESIGHASARDATSDFVRRSAASMARFGSGMKTKVEAPDARKGTASDARATTARTTRPAPVRVAPSHAPAPTEPPAAAATAAPAPRETAPAIVTRGEVTTPAHGVPEDPRLAAVDTSAPVRTDQITMRVEGDAGIEARLRVAVRGRDVRATIVSDDPVLARRLEDGLGNLRQALGERGFERTQVVVQSTGAARGESNDTTRDPNGSRRHPDSGTSHAQDRRSDTSDPRSRRRDGRTPEER